MGTGSSGSRNRAFFHLRSTHRLIDELSALDPVTLYVGAGASIERTGLSWAGLSAQLLDRDLGNYSERIDLVRASTSLQVSSAIAQQYKTTRTDGWRDRLRDAICDQLYRGPKDLTSYFNDRVISAANALIHAGKSAVVVTPNYDQFLIDALNDLENPDLLVAKEKASFSRREVFAFGVDSKGDPIDPTAQLEDLLDCMKQQSVLCVVYLHGFVGRETPSDQRLADAYPVVSEKDYAVTRDTSQLVLAHLFAERNAIVVGSSITDPPLIHALVTSRPKRATRRTESGTIAEGPVKRFAIMPTHAASLIGVTPATQAGLRKVEAQRAAHLGIKLVTPPFFYQAPQLLEELRVNLEAEEVTKYSDMQAVHRYGFRLSAWWFNWLYGDETDMVERQADAYRFLQEQALPEVRRILDTPAGEAIKLEAWIRWYPEERQLGLWAASTGTWPDFETMRKDPLALSSTYAATRAFLNGAPNYMKSTSDDSRWRSYLAKPIRYLEENYLAHLPVGVISVSSMWEQEESSINPRVRGATPSLFNYLDSVGWVLFGLDAAYESDDDQPKAE